MNDIFNAIYTDGDILQTLVKLFILMLMFDCILGFANCIKTLKGVV